MREDKPYYELRKEMYAKGVTQQDIAEELGRGDTYVSTRFSGKGQHGFTIEDAYTILDMLELPGKDLPKFFPDYRHAAGGRSTRSGRSVGRRVQA